MSGDGVVAHNRRTYFAENVDPTRTHLNVEYCYTPIEEAYPNLCRQTDDDEQGGLTFEIDRRRFAVRLTAPYSDERRQAASELAKGNTNRLRNAK